MFDSRVDAFELEQGALACPPSNRQIVPPASFLCLQESAQLEPLNLET
jgi:hypothetical protein